MRRLGVGYRKQLASWINTHPEQINCLEITAEHFFSEPERLKKLRNHYDLLVHGLGLSLGTPGPIDSRHLQRFVEICQIADPLWISEHIAFTKTRDVDLGHLNPIHYTQDTLEYFIDHVLEVKAACQRPLLLENITSHIKIDSPIPETDFINQLCERAGCHLLLDVTNLFVNSRNHHYQPTHWLYEINPEHIKQLHIVGYSEQHGTFHDSHANNIQQELYDLTRQVIEHSSVETIIIERDNNFPPVSQLAGELQTLEQCFETG
jgi:uncharacterized protein (UPF0276 family)